MDNFTINRIAYIRQQEILDRTAQHHGGIPLRKLLRPVGMLLVVAGQHLLDSAHHMTTPAATPPLISSETLEVCDPFC